MSRPLRVAVLLPQVPFQSGGAEILARRLVEAVAAEGHESDLITLPFKWYPDRVLLESALAWRLLDLSEANGQPIDVVIATKYPSYLVQHPRKVVWLFHQFRQAYDMHGSRFGQFAEDPRGAAMREAIIQADQRALDEARAVFAISGNVARRLARFCDREAEILLPPPQELPELPGSDEGYVLSVGRLDAAKRLDLLLHALSRVDQVKTVIVGEGPEREALARLAAGLGLENRVAFRGRVGPEELARLYGRCRAVYYAPHDEDYGFVTLEAQLARKPVITATDSGGPLDFIDHEVTGLVVEPQPDHVAAALRRICGDPRLAVRLGESARERIRLLSWEGIARRLLAAAK